MTHARDDDSVKSAPPVDELPGERSHDLPPHVKAEIEALARRQKEAGSLLLSLVNAAGGVVENGLERLPDGVKDRIEKVTRNGLERAYRLAVRTGGGKGSLGPGAHRAVATLSGAVGGMGGIGTSIVELPVTITMIFRGLQRIAADNGFDPSDERTLFDCLQVFASGGPLKLDDGVNTAFLTARFTITGPTMQRLIASAAAPFSVVLGQKIAAQSVPLIGAAAGASINFAFVGYYQEMARVRFGLKRLARDHDPVAVAAAFAAAMEPKRLS